MCTVDKANHVIETTGGMLRERENGDQRQKQSQCIEMKVSFSALNGIGKKRPDNDKDDRQTNWCR